MTQGIVCGWCVVVCCCVLAVACQPPPPPVVGVTWPSTQPVPSAFGAAGDALSAGRPDEALKQCRTTMSTLQTTVMEALAAASLDGPPEAAARVRELLEEHVYASPASLVVIDDHFAFSADVLRLCGRAAFDAGAREDATRWLSGLAEQTPLDAATARALQTLQRGQP